MEAIPLFDKFLALMLLVSVVICFIIALSMFFVKTSGVKRCSKFSRVLIAIAGGFVATSCVVLLFLELMAMINNWGY